MGRNPSRLNAAGHRVDHVSWSFSRTVVNMLERAAMRSYRAQKARYLVVFKITRWD